MSGSSRQSSERGAGMYKIVVAFAALAALAIVGIAQSSISAQSTGGEDRLFGGGRFVFDFGPGFGVQPRDISVSATGLDGRRGSGTRYYGHPDRATPAPPTLGLVSRRPGERGRHRHHRPAGQPDRSVLPGQWTSRPGSTRRHHAGVPSEPGGHRAVLAEALPARVPVGDAAGRVGRRLVDARHGRHRRRRRPARLTLAPRDRGPLLRGALDPVRLSVS